MQLTLDFQENAFDAEYNKLVKNVLDNGEVRSDRTGVGTVSIFGAECQYDLSRGEFPLLTTKKVNFEYVVRELLWFLSGSTNCKDLGPAEVLWKSWADENGFLPHIYSRQWRDWSSMSLPRVDQISDLIHNIKTAPNSRRLVVSAWNAAYINAMALPPCHTLFQCYVRQSKYLDLKLYQRSADVAIGVPFNIASYSLLTMMLAKECGLLPGVFHHSLGDVHVYQNHVELLREQIARPQHTPPTVSLSCSQVLDTRLEDVSIENYRHEPFIKYLVAV